MSNSQAYKWSTIDRLVTTVITTGGNIAMARMLSLHDFSLLAMVGIFTAVADNLSSCGMSDWLLREPKPKPVDYSTAFVFNSSLGLIFGLLFISCGSYLAKWFNEPEINPIMKVIGVCFFLGTMSFVQETRLRKLLEIKKIAIVKILSSLCAVGLGIYLAINGYGFWALVSCRVLLSAFVFFFYLFASRWFPGLKFSVHSFKAMFSYGVNLLLSYVCIEIGHNVNAFILGKVSTVSSGLYSQAQKMSDVPFNITNSSVSTPFLAVVSNEEKREIQTNIITDMAVNVLFLNFSIMLLLFVIAYAGFNTLFGCKWDGAVPIFRILIGVCCLLNVKRYISTVLKFHNRTDKIRNYTVLEVLFQLGLLALSFRYGVLWIAASQLLAAIIMLIPYGRLYVSVEPHTIGMILGQFCKSLLAPAIATAITLVGQSMWGGIVPVFVDLAVSVVVFGATMWVICSRIEQPVYVRMRRFVRKSV